MKLSETLIDTSILFKVYGETIGKFVFGITNDSRNVKKGYIFVAVRGLTVDGHRYIDNAIENGAVVVVGENELSLRWIEKAAYIRVKNSRKALGQIASAFYNHPSQKLKVIGVTGTDGKTTTLNIIHHLLVSLNKKVGMIGTVGAVINGKKSDTGLHVSTPEAVDMQKYLAKMVKAGCEYAVLETTSHALDQGRLEGVEFDIGVLTNITPEHLDYHKTFARYVKAKLILFNNSKTAILNSDDESFSKLQKLILPKIKIKTYGTKGKVDYKAKNIKLNPTRYSLICHKKEYDVDLSLDGKFNISNSLAAIGVIDSLGLPVKKAVESLEMVKSPEGRVQSIGNNKELKIIIDFAHTPNGVENILQLYSKTKKRKLITIVSAEGERDPSKRREIPKIATKYADVIILNPIDPRSEDPKKILKDMAMGAKAGGALQINNKYFRSKNTIETPVFIDFVDRGEAISFAINKIAIKGDTILILGKGHEKSMAIKGVEYPWSDKRAVKLALNGKVLEII